MLIKDYNTNNGNIDHDEDNASEADEDLKNNLNLIDKVKELTNGT